MQKEKRIALFLPSLRGGGAERVMLELAKEIAERGHAVDMLLAKAEGAYLKEVPDAVRLIDFDSSRVAASFPGLVRYLRRERPVALISAMAHVNVVAIGARALARVPLRLLITEHNNLSLVRQNAKSWRSRVVIKLMQVFYPSADVVVAVSNGVADDLAQAVGLSRDVIEVVYNPVVTERLRLLSREPWPAKLALNEPPPVILGVGRLTKQKDFSTLIRAFAHLREERSVRLVIFGEGEERATLETLAKELGVAADVALPGFTENPFSIMRGSSVFVLSSAWEGLPTVLIEAMACGVRVVSTDCPSGPSEILENGCWGRLVPVGDAVALAEAVAEALDDPAPPDVERRARDFSRRQAADKYLRLLSRDMDLSP